MGPAARSHGGTEPGSAQQRAASRIDAVAQTIESLWASDETAVSRRFARRALGLLLPHIEAFATVRRRRIVALLQRLRPASSLGAAGVEAVEARAPPAWVAHRAQAGCQQPFAPPQSSRSGAHGALEPMILTSMPGDVRSARDRSRTGGSPHATVTNTPDIPPEG